MHAKRLHYLIEELRDAHSVVPTPGLFEQRYGRDVTMFEVEDRIITCFDPDAWQLVDAAAADPSVPLFVVPAGGSPRGGVYARVRDAQPEIGAGEHERLFVVTLPDGVFAVEVDPHGETFGAAFEFYACDISTPVCYTEGTNERRGTS